MSSYYNRISGTLEPTKIARVADIHLIQSSIEDAFSRLIVDMFGPAFILGHEKDSLTLVPTPLHIDQSSTSVDDNQQWISCYSRYFRQGIDIRKSEIDSIIIHMTNESNITVNVFAEIRDINYNLIKEANAVLSPTNGTTYQEVTFDFNEKHLPIGHYYFVLRPIDLSSIDLTINGDETEYDTIEDWMFQVKYDINGNYKGALEASYNGKDYMQSRLLADQSEKYEKADLYFEQVFSRGNTYLITPGAAIIRGQKTYPVDTHITIDGPNSSGDRIDLVTLTADGKLNVIQGSVYNGEKIYPVSDAGLKIAYITTYKSSVSQWACTNCGHINEGNTDTCSKCGELTNEKIPLIEQGDEIWGSENHFVTRERSVLERLRRLEKKMNYTLDRNSPSRIKYVCTIDPIIDNNGSALDKEGTYGMTAVVNSAGETVYVPKTGYNVQQMYWSIRDQAGEKVTTVTTEIKGILTGYNLTKKFKGPEQFKAHLKDPDTGNALANKDITITINGKTYNRKTDVQGYAYLNINLSAGTYTVQSSYGDATVTNTVTVLDENATETTTSDGKDSTMTIGTRVSQTSTVTEGTIIPNYVITGDDSFYKDAVTVDTTAGKISLKKTEYANDTYSSNTPLSKSKQFSSKEIGYTIRNNGDRVNQNSEYAVLNFTIKHDCDIKSITPYITKFQNLESFSIVLFKNDEVFNLMKTPGLCYQKRAKDDATFPNIYESPEFSLTEAATTKSNTITLSKPATFTPETPLHLEAGSYSLWVRGKLKNGQNEGTIFIQEYETLSETDTYGVSTKCLGTSDAQNGLIYLETNNISNRSWDLIFEKKNHVYFERGIVMSKGISTSNRIYSCSVSKNYNIPEGCSISTYVSNNGGRTWVNASNGNVTFSGTGSIFKWRLVLNGTGDTTPEVYFNNDKGYALLFNVGTAEDFTDYEDYQRCFETQLLDGNLLTNFLLAANTEKRFSEWEFGRLWMEDEDKTSKIDICVSYNEDDPLVQVGQKKQYWPSKTFFSTVFSDLTVNDFQHTSVDYDNYNDAIEFDEHNYRFDLNEDYQYNYNNGVVISQGQDAGDINVEHIDDSFKYSLIDSNYVYDYTGETSAYVSVTKNNTAYNALFKTRQLNKVYQTADKWQASLTADANVSLDNIPLYFTINGITYERKTNENGVAGLNINLLPGSYTATVQYKQGNIPKATLTTVITVVDNQNALVDPKQAGATLSSGPYRRAMYIPDDLEANETRYYCSKDKNSNHGDPLYNHEKIILGVAWPQGLDISDNYLGLTLDIIPDLVERDSDDLRAKDADGNMIIPAGSLEVVVSLNANGLIEDNNATYGKAYTISQDLINRKHNTVGIDLNEDIYAYGNVHSIGIRIKDTNDPKCTLICRKQGEDDYAADSIGLGLIRLTSYNIRPFIPYGRDQTLWKKIPTTGETHAYAEFDMNKQDVSPNRGNGYSFVGYYPLTHSSNISKDSSGKIVDKSTTAIKSAVLTKSGTHYYDASCAYSDGVTKTYEEAMLYGTKSIKFDLRDGDLGNLFKINVDTPLKPYNFIKISYYIAAEVDDSMTTEYVDKDTTVQESAITSGSIRKGDIYIDFYDTTDIKNNAPIESFPLPAWGKTAKSSIVRDKTVNAFFRKRSDATTVKCIVLRRENPAKDEVKGMNLHIVDIVGYHSNVMPALGPQMLMRIYPNTLEDLNVPKIRKYGVIFKLQ